MASIIVKTVNPKQKQNQRMKGAGVPRAPSQLGLLPPTRQVRLKYCDTQQFDPTAGQFKRFIYSCNSLFDPYYTGVGHQPMGFDQMASMYAHYVVTSSRITLRALHTPTIPVAFGVLATDQNDHAGPWTTVCEQPKHVAYTILPNVAQQVKAVTLNWSLRDSAGVIDPLDAGDYGAVVSASPVDQNFYVIFMQVLDLSADVANVWIELEIEYTAIFSVTKDLVSS
jgi:hypothetical protein